MGGRLQDAKWRRVAGLAILALVPLLNCGCLAVAAGAAATGVAAAGFVYFEGKDSREYPAGLEDTWQATRVALADLGMPIVRAEREENKGSLESRTAENEVVNLGVDTVPGKSPADPPLTRVSVRVALLGDHPVGTRILDQIGYHLVPTAAKGQPPLAPTPGTGGGPPPATTEPPRWSAPAPAPAPPSPPPETRAPPLLPGGPPGSH
jgi:hypothetical protein